MKKLLTILGSLTVMTSAGSLVVACKSKTETQSDTGSDFIAKDGTIKLDAVSLLRWYQKNVGFNSVKQVKEFNQLFAVGLMVEAANPKSTIFYGEKALWKEPTLTSNQYGLEKFPAKLKEIWGKKDDKVSTTVQGAANNAFKEFEKNYDGKNSRTTIVNELKKQFPYVDAKYDSLKTAWINNYLLTNSENGALAKLTKLLWNDSSADIRNDSPNREALLRTFYSLWKNSTVASLENDINQAINNNWNDEKNGIGEEHHLNLVNLINATGGTNPKIATGDSSSDPTKIPTWKLSEVKWADKATKISPDLVKDLLARLYTPNANSGSKIDKQYEGSRTVNQHWNYVKKDGDILTKTNTYFNLVDNYPNPDFTNQEYDLSSTKIFGFLTNSQRFGIDQYLINEKPIALSEIVFKKKESGDLAVNIDGEAFLNPSGVTDKTWTQFYGLYNFLQNYVMGDNPGIKETIPGISQYNFDTIFGNLSPEITNVIRLNWPQSETNRSDKWDSSFYEGKNNDKFLTLSDSTYSKILKYSVYDFIQANTDKNIYTYELDPNPKNAGAIRENLINDYGFINPETANTIAGSVDKITNSTLKTEATNGLYATLNLIEKLNRKIVPDNNGPYAASADTSSSDDQKNNKVYQVLNKEQGIIAFVDTDGLHITKINGYDLLNNNNGNHAIKQQTSNIFGSTIDERTNYVNELAAFKRLNEYEKSDTNIGSYRYIYQDYNNQIFNPNRAEIEDGFISKIVNGYEIKKLPDFGVSYEQLNPAITNDYERFLVNNSILSSRNPSLAPFYKFNIFNEVKDYLTINDSKNDVLSPNNSWVVDYSGIILGFNPDDKTKFIQDILNKFMKFDTTVDSEEFHKWIADILETNIKHTENAPRLEFRKNWTQWNKEIDDSRADEDVEKNQNLPLMKLDWGTDQSHIQKIISLNLFNPFMKTPFYEYRLDNQWYEQIYNLAPLKRKDFK